MGEVRLLWCGGSGPDADGLRGSLAGGDGEEILRVAQASEGAKEWRFEALYAVGGQRAMGGQAAPFRGVRMRIGMTRVYVQDVDGGFRFYTETLGFPERLPLPEAGLAIVVSPEDSGGIGLLLQPNANPIANSYQEAIYQAGLPEIVFSVEDVQSEYACGNLIQLHQA